MSGWIVTRRSSGASLAATATRVLTRGPCCVSPVVATGSSVLRLRTALSAVLLVAVVAVARGRVHQVEKPTPNHHRVT